MPKAWYNPFRVPPAPPAFGKDKVVPDASSSWLSRLTLQWLSAFLDVGFSRPLEKEDLWDLPPARHTDRITRDVELNFYARCAPAKRPRSMRKIVPDESVPGTEKHEAELEKGIPLEDATNSDDTKFDESLFKALHRTFFKRIWMAGALLLVSDTLKTTTPLVSKVLLTWLTESYLWARLSESDRLAAVADGFTKPRGVGYGVGLAFGLFAMQESASLMTNHFMLMSMSTGLYARTGLIGNIFRKSLRLSGKARGEHSVGQITTMISTDATHMDQFSLFAHYLWDSPLQLVIGIGLLIANLGYSALVGLGVLVAGLPFQFALVMVMMNQRQKGVKLTDKRVRLTSEVLQGIRLIKLYGWEGFYAEQITKFRRGEIQAIRTSAFATALLVAMFSFLPIIGAILSFITYALTGHELNIAIIFTCLQLFNIIRIPLIIFPFVSRGLAEALVALARISKFLLAEELEEPYLVDKTLPDAVQVDGDFEWETVFNPPGTDEDAKTEKNIKEKEKSTSDDKGAKEAGRKSTWWSRSKKVQVDVEEPSEKSGNPEEQSSEASKATPKSDEQIFGLKDLQMTVPKGAFVAIVGRVGSGKSSVLQALIGEMRRIRGEVKLGGPIAYAPQIPWIKNATLRENVLFGQPDDHARFQEVVKACGLEHDLTILPQGESTYIGEKGINLSGGQKARVSLARVAFSTADIVLLDDPLSAVDSYVGNHILENCLLSGPLADRTRILVTHTLHVLDKTDYIYVLDNGVIVEQGRYADLMSQNAVFSRLIEEYGSADTGGPQNSLTTKGTDSTRKGNQAMDESADALIQLEERNVGAVSWVIYKKYLRFAGGLRWAPFLLTLLLLNEGTNVVITLFLGFWSGDTIHHFQQRDYMSVYAGLGVALAFVSFTMTYGFIMVGLNASLNLFRAALVGVLHSPASFFDTTPMGRIVSRLSKDQDSIDNELPVTLMQFLTALSSVFGTIALVFYTFPYLGIIFLPLGILYYVVSVYYRRSSVETKRLDSLMRSFLYGSFSETLTGLSTIRAYGEQARSIINADQGLDMENRAYMMTNTMQRWLALRLDFFGNIVILGIALFASGFRSSNNPAKIGVVLSYTLAVTQVFSEMINMFAQSEQSMNAVERILHYVELPREGLKQSEDEPPTAWPENGEIEFNGVQMAYRENLPLVLKGVDLKIRGGEKIGIVGRTGSGKSSLIQTLFRMVELQGGKIVIDGHDISTVSLARLRTSLALVPQDTTLFLGTLRDNLDPQRLRTDAELISVLQRAHVIPKEGNLDLEAKFSLDSIVGDEGSNYSVGEKQLLALCRALVKQSRIIVLDEATSSVDVETDSKIQRTIQREFASSTLLCIAHRINTIVHYDRILVMDDGKIAEFDTVLNLFDDANSIFRSLCNEAKLQRSDILKIRADYSGN